MRLGVDLGGTKIEIIALDAAGNTLDRRRVPTPKDGYMPTVMAIAGLVETVENTLGRRGTVGIGIPGAESAPTGLIKNANSTCLIGHPLKRDLQALLQRDIRITNDANCFALSEATDGAAAGASSVFGVILGTGVGGGIVIDGKVLSGVNRIAGEWGHNPLPFPDAEALPLRPCYCGRAGCIETYLSGPAMSGEYATLAAQSGGTGKTPAEIGTGAEAGDALCQQVMDRYVERLARSLAGVINILDPEAIVLGGGLSQLAALYEAVPQRWGRYVFSDQVLTRLLSPVHGDSSGVRGAAWLWD